MAKTQDDQLTKVSVTWASEVDGGLLLLIKTPDGNARNFKIITQAYDTEKKEYYDDEETFETAKELAESYGADINDPTSFMGKEIEVYVLDDRVSSKPIQQFIRYDKLTPAVARKVGKGGPYETTPVTDFVGQRFNVGIVVPTGKVDEDGNEEVAKYRLSNFVIPAKNEDEKDTIISLKYATKEIDTYRKQIEDGVVPKTMVKEIEAAIDELLEISRARKAEELRKVFGGKSADEMIESGETFTIDVEAVSGDFTYLKGLLPEDAE